MAQEDVQDLIAYLKVMDSQSDPAISSSTIRVGTVLPTEGRHTALGQAIRQTIEAVFDEVNAKGGVNDRELQLAVGGWNDDGNPQIWAARDLVNKEPVAALVSPYVPNYDAELEALATEKRLPVVGPYTVLQPDGDEDEDNRFDQADALGFASVTEEVFELNEFPAESTVLNLQGKDTQAVLFLGNAAELSQFARRAAEAGWQPLLLSPGLLAERNVFELPESFDGRVLLSYASLPTDYSPEGAADFELLHEKYGFDYSYSIAQVNAYLAARVLVEGIERAGRNLTRQQLLEALEGLDDFHPGLAPALSFGEDRRIGSVGTHIVPVDLVEDRFTEPVRWIVPPLEQ
jgi:ABC-type branched-subunit amino acid transport system substrate-binding protein